MESGGRITVHDLARAAGVSLATIDRVLNGRPGVRPTTAQKVEAAIARIGFRRDLTASMLARARDIGVRVIVPQGTNQFFGKLAEAVETVGRQMRAERMRLDMVRVRALDTKALAEALDATGPDHYDCAAIVAIDKSEVHAAVARAASRGIKIITLVSDLPDSARHEFVGIDNLAAGRTAASLMGRFLPQGGTVGLVAGSRELIDHAERIEGFRAVMKEEFPAIAIAGPVEGQDAFAPTLEATRSLLAKHPQLAGLYNAGAGNAGMLMALSESGRAGTLRVITHELTGPTRAGLTAGSIDLVLDQSPEDEIHAVCATARRLVLGPDAAPPMAPIGIKVFLRDNLR